MVVCVAAVGCSVADKEVEDQSGLASVFEELDLSGLHSLEDPPPQTTVPAEVGPSGPVDSRVEHERKRKAFRQDLVRRLDFSREVTRVGGPGRVENVEVTKVFRRYRGHIIRCYESVLKSAPELHGQVGVRFTLRATGRVEAAVLTENTTQSEALGSCITRRLLRLRFPEPQGGFAAFSWGIDLAPLTSLR